jgi:hypothetical protein
MRPFGNETGRAVVSPPQAEGGFFMSKILGASASNLSRRQLLIGASVTWLCAPAIVRATSLMLVRSFALVRGVVFPFEPVHYNFVTRVWVSCHARTFKNYQDAGLSAYDIARTINNRVPKDWAQWNADGVLSILRTDKAIRRQDAIMRAARLGRREHFELIKQNAAK